MRVWWRATRHKRIASVFSYHEDTRAERKLQLSNFPGLNRPAAGVLGDLSRLSEMKRVVLLLLAVFLTSCGSSDTFPPSGAPATNPSSSNNSNLKLVLRASQGTLDGTGEKLVLRLTPSQANLLIGENGEGGVLDIDQYLAQTSFSESAPGEAELEYQIGGTTKVLPLKLLGANRETDGTVTLRALERAVVTTASPNFQSQVGTSALAVHCHDGDTPLAGVEVTLDSLSGSRQTRVSVTNNDGDTLFLSLSSGYYTVTAVKQGYRTFFSSLAVPIGQPVTADLSLVPSTSGPITSGILRIIR